MTSGAYRVMNLATNAWSTVTIGGTGPTLTTETAHYCRRFNQVIGRKNGDGASVRVLDLPSSIGGSWGSWRTVAAVSGGVTPPDSDEEGWYTRFNIIQDWGDGRPGLIFLPRQGGPTYAYIIDSAL
jgi:hypothetical protein